MNFDEQKTFQVDLLVFAFPFSFTNSIVLLILIQEQRVQNAGKGVFEALEINFCDPPYLSGSF